jgi:hypothetical protein
MIMSRRARWAADVTRMVKMKANRLLEGKPEGRRPQVDQDVGGWIELKYRDRMGWYGLDWSGSG